MRPFITNQGSCFADEEDIFACAKLVDCREKKISSGGIPIWSDTNKAYLLDSDTHACIFGGTGSMKTLRLICPSIAFLAKSGESMIINDPKAELYGKFSRYLSDLGYTVHVLNFRDTGVGSRWNPFSYPVELWKKGEVDRSNTYIRDYAKSTYSTLAAKTNDAFWPSVSQDFFVGLAQIVRHHTAGEALTLENIRFLNAVAFERMEKHCCNNISYIYQRLNKASEAAVNIAPVIEAPNDTRESIRSVFGQPLSLYGLENLKDMMCESDFDISSFGKNKSVLFIISPDERSTFNPVIAAFIKQSYSILVDTACECVDGSLPVRVNYILDEFSNLPAIEDFDSMISAARSRNVRFTLVVQSLAQLASSYSQHTVKNIINNCGAWFVMQSKDIELHSVVEKMCGNHTGEYSGVEKPLITTTDIQKLNKQTGEVLLLINGRDPFITTLPHIYEYPFSIPEHPQVSFKKRKPIKRRVFDIREYIKQREAQERLKADLSLQQLSAADIEFLEGYESILSGMDSDPQQ